MSIKISKPLEFSDLDLRLNSLPLHYTQTENIWLKSSVEKEEGALLSTGRNR
jgi:hypothetical protein